MENHQEEVNKYLDSLYAVLDCFGDREAILVITTSMIGYSIMEHPDLQEKLATLLQRISDGARAKANAAS